MVGGRATRVLVDANILSSKTLRDWIALLYLRGGHTLFQVLWTEDLMAETLRTIRKRNPLASEAAVGGVRRRIAETFGRDATIVGFAIDPTIEYPDPGDAHIHAAACHAEIDILLTANTSDFDRLDELPYEIHTADDFFELVDCSQPDLVQRVMLEQVAYWVRRKGKPLPEALRNAGAPRFAERIRGYLQTADVEQVLNPSR